MVSWRLFALVILAQGPVADYGVVIKLVGVVFFLALAGWLWRFARRPSEEPAHGAADDEAPPPTSANKEKADATELVSRDQLPPATQDPDRTPANKEVGAGDGKTEFIARDELLRPKSTPQRTAPYDQLSPQVGNTEFIDRDELLSATSAPQGTAPDRPDAQIGDTEFIDRDELFSAMPAPQSTAPYEHLNPQIGNTEFLSREEIVGAVSDADGGATATESVAPPKFQAPAPAARVTPSIPEPPRAAPPASGTPEENIISNAELERAFAGAVEALRELEEGLASERCDLAQLASGPEQRWQGHTEMIMLAGSRAIEDFAEPMLRDGQTEHQRVQGALVLLKQKSANGAKHLLNILGDLGQDARRSAHGAIAWWDGSRLDSLLRAGLEQAREDDKVTWLEMFVTLARDPGAEAIDEALESGSTEMLTAGLRAVPVHAQPERYKATVERHLHTLAVRRWAVETALVLGSQTAWILSRGLARDPNFPELCELRALSGSQSVCKELLEWVGQRSVPNQGPWCLGLTGRVEGIEKALEFVTHDDEAVARSALAGFAAATGYRATGESEAGVWWEENRGRFDPAHRYVGGRPYSVESVQAQLRTGAAAHRRVLVRELAVRSKGRARVRSSALPAQQLEDIASLAALELDFLSGYG